MLRHQAGDLPICISVDANAEWNGDMLQEGEHEEEDRCFGSSFLAQCCEEFGLVPSLTDGTATWHGNRRAKAAYDHVLLSGFFARSMASSKVEQTVISTAGAIDHLPVTVSLRMRAGKQQKSSSWAPEWDDEQTQEVYKALWQQVPTMPASFPAWRQHCSAR